MYSAQRSFFVLLTSIAMLAALGISASYTFADDCTAGTRAATSEDLPKMREAGIPNPVVGMCWNASDTSVGKDVAEAKAFLRTRYQAGGCSSKNASPNDAIDKLDAQFAINLAKMLRRAPMVINIISAYRSPTAQACANPSVKNSNHTRGCAVDLQYSQSDCNSDMCKWVVKEAPADKLHIRMRYSPEWNHLEPMTCGGTSTGNPTGTPTSGPGSYAPRMANTLNSLGNLFSPPQQQCPQGSMMMNGSCLPPQAAQAMQTNSPFSYAPPPSPTSNPSDTGGSTYPTGASGGTTGGTNTNTNTNSNTNGNTTGSINLTGSNDLSGIHLTTGSTSTSTRNTSNSNGISAIDLINHIANPTSTDDTIEPTATGTPVQLNGSLSNTASLQGTSTQLDPSWHASTTYSLSPTAPQTFVSQDLSQTPTSLHPAQPTNSTFAILENVRQTLVRILTILRPFGGVVPNTTPTHTSAVAYMR